MSEPIKWPEVVDDTPAEDKPAQTRRGDGAPVAKPASGGADLVSTIMHGAAHGLGMMIGQSVMQNRVSDRDKRAVYAHRGKVRHARRRRLAVG